MTQICHQNSQMVIRCDQNSLFYYDELMFTIHDFKILFYFFENYFYRIIFGEKSAVPIEIYRLKLRSTFRLGPIITGDLRTGVDLDRQNVALWFSKELRMKTLGSGTIMIYLYSVHSFKFNCSLSQSLKETHCEIAGKNLERSSAERVFKSVVI